MHCPARYAFSQLETPEEAFALRQVAQCSQGRMQESDERSISCGMVD